MINSVLQFVYQIQSCQLRKAKFLMATKNTKFQLARQGMSSSSVLNAIISLNRNRSVDIVVLFLQYRRFSVHTGYKGSSARCAIKGMTLVKAQYCSAFSMSTLTNDDVPATNSRKFLCADDICLGTQGGSVTEIENVRLLATFYAKRMPQPSASATVAC